MAIEKKITVDLIEINENNVVQARIKTDILENGEQIGSQLSYQVIQPGDDYSDKDARVKAVCTAIHTQSVVNAYKATLDNATV